MNLNTIKPVLIIAGIVLFSGCKNTDQLQLSAAKIFSDHMVLQRDMSVRFWGTATPGTTVRVNISSMKGKTRAGDSGNWLVEIPAMSAGGPFELTITNGKKIIFTDILIGDVWLASGQSNMEFSLQSADNSNEGLALNVVSPEYSDTAWDEMKIPQTIDESKIGPFEGVIWFRKSVMLRS